MDVPHGRCRGDRKGCGTVGEGEHVGPGDRASLCEKLMAQIGKRESTCSLFLIFPEICWKSGVFKAGSKSGNFLVSGGLGMEGR